MADTKRQSIGAKTTTQKTCPPGINELDAALSKAIGAKIRITTTLPGYVVEGTLYTACAITHMVAINTTPIPPNPSTNLASQPGDYKIIPISSIQNFQIINLTPTSDNTQGPDACFENAVPSITKLDMSTLKAKEELAIRKVKEHNATRGKNVTKEAQDIFDWFSRTLPTRWDDQTIVVNDSVLIEVPYKAENVKGPKDKQNALVQIKKVLEGYYQKKKTTPSQQPVARPTPAVPMGQRKGG